MVVETQQDQMGTGRHPVISRIRGANAWGGEMGRRWHGPCIGAGLTDGAPGDGWGTVTAGDTSWHKGGNAWLCLLSALTAPPAPQPEARGGGGCVRELVSAVGA